MKEITGRHVFIGFCLAFGTIIAANLALAINAVKTFPGLEVKNTYVASQTFDAERHAQEALFWETAAQYETGSLNLRVSHEGVLIQPEIVEAVFGRPTNMRSDQVLDFTMTPMGFVAEIEAAPGEWRLQLTLRADDGTLFRQSLPVRVQG